MKDQLCRKGIHVWCSWYNYSSRSRPLCTVVGQAFPVQIPSHFKFWSETFLKGWCQNLLWGLPWTMLRNSRLQHQIFVYVPEQKLLTSLGCSPCTILWDFPTGIICLHYDKSALPGTPQLLPDESRTKHERIKNSSWQRLKHLAPSLSSSPFETKMKNSEGHAYRAPIPYFFFWCSSLVFIWTLSESGVQRHSYGTSANNPFVRPSHQPPPLSIFVKRTYFDKKTSLSFFWLLVCEMDGMRQRHVSEGFMPRVPPPK